MERITITLTEDQLQFIKMLVNDYVLNIHSMDLNEGQLAYARRVNNQLHLELVK